MKRIVALLMVCLLLTTGCSLGPKFEQDFHVPPPSEDLSSRTVVVSGFVGAHYKQSRTQSGDIETLREQAGTRDISPEIAEALRGKGIDAEARVGVDESALGPGEVWLRGGVSASGTIGWDMSRGSNWVTFTVCLGTVGILGMWLPGPLSWVSTVDVTYAADVVDHNGRFLAHVGETRLESHFDNYWFWGANDDTVVSRTLDAATDEVGAEVANWFR